MILDRIVRHKRKEVALLKRKTSLAALQKALGQKKRKHAFFKSLAAAKGVAVIAEIKRRSPSKGILRKNFKPLDLAREFEASGASALSVLTDNHFFGGSLEILKKVRTAVDLPILRKDFVIDEYQIYEAALAGADAVLLIAAILSPEELARFSRLASKLGLDVLFEVHDRADIKKVLPLKPKIAGINNRDLRTFTVTLSTTSRLARFFSKRTILVSESGIFTRADIDRVRGSGVRAVLVGESLMKQPRPGRALGQLLGNR